MLFKQFPASVGWNPFSNLYTKILICRLIREKSFGGLYEIASINARPIDFDIAVFVFNYKVFIHNGLWSIMLSHEFVERGGVNHHTLPTSANASSMRRSRLAVSYLPSPFLIPLAASQ